MPEETDQLARLKAAFADRYRVERELGHGGMATVYLAEDLKHHRPVALKVLRPELAAALGPERFLREIEVTARLNHPHILPLLDSGDADGFLYYAMPYVEGESLRDRLTREKQLPLEDSLQITREVADALNYAHSHDVVHRDIKPENILLESGHAVVADFGIARAITAAGGERLTETGIAIGTPAYMSPEQAAGDKDLDGRSDLYALGCVLYELLAGRPPFVGPTKETVLHQHQIGEPPSVTSIRPAVPGGVEAALKRALAKTPADRFATGAQLSEALSPGPQTWVRHRVGSKWSWRRTALAATVLSVVGAVAIWVVLTRRTSTRADLAESAVIVMPLENRTQDASLAPLSAVTADYVARGLTEAGFLRVKDTQEALAAAQALGTGATAVKVGRETGAGAVVEGSYFLQGDSVEFQARIVSAADGAILRTIPPIGAARDRPLDGVELLGQRVLGAFASLQDKDLTSFLAALSQPPTYPAYREFIEGIKSYMRIDYVDAFRHFQQAAVLDSNFLTTRVWAAQAALWIEGDSAPRILAALRPIRNRLNSYDRARFDFVAALHGPGPGVAGPFYAPDLDGAYRAARRMVDAAPGSVDAQREAALSALRVLRPREALSRLQSLDPEHGPMREWVVYWAAVAWADHLLGQYQQELSAARHGRRLFPKQNPLYELRALAALGQVRELDSLFRVGVASYPAWYWPGRAAYYLAGELRAHGHPEAARNLARYEQEQLATHPAPDSRGVSGKDEWLRQRTELALFLGENEAASELIAQFHHPENYGWLRARVLAAQGRLEVARRTLEETNRWAAQSIGPSLPGQEIHEAGVLVRLGDLEGALQVLAKRAGDPIFIGTRGEDGHATLALAPLWGNPRFQALIRPKD